MEFKDWKFGLTLLGLTLFFVFVPYRPDESSSISAWLGFVVIICFLGLIYEWFKCIDRFKARRKK